MIHLKPIYAIQAAYVKKEIEYLPVKEIIITSYFQKRRFAVNEGCIWIIKIGRIPKAFSFL
ncbi:MAG: hypothetical protein M3Z01_00505 [Thermoproteota archaeon]|nr:hypothetical protein [Thermoproteota archaeon]